MARARSSPGDPGVRKNQDQVPEVRGGEAPDFTAMRPPGGVPPDPQPRCPKCGTAGCLDDAAATAEWEQGS